MIETPSSLRTGRLSALAATFVALIVGGWLVIPDTQSQSPSSTTNNAALTTMITKIKEQQDQMAANQTKIEVQTAQLQEALRQAKIYSARGGSGHR